MPKQRFARRDSAQGPVQSEMVSKEAGRTVAEHGGPGQVAERVRELLRVELPVRARVAARGGDQHEIDMSEAGAMRRTGGDANKAS